MRKQYIYTVISMLAFLIVSACSLHEEEDFFNDSSANRMSEALKKYKEILIAPENGWIMQYYPSNNQALGGYNLLVSFDESGNATVAGELSESDETVTSLYSLIQSAGPVLTFDSYNEIMHLFSEPLGGYEGEFQFTIMSADPDKVMLSGTKTRNMITLTPMPKEQKWSDYLESVNKIQKEIFLGTFNLMVNGKKIGSIAQNKNVFTLTYSGEGVEVVEKKIPFIYTDEGLRFYEPLTVDGTTISTFKVDIEKLSYNCIDEGVDAKLESYYPDGYYLYEQLVGTYKVGTKTVKVTANPDGKTYSLIGLSNYGVAQAEYVRSSGTFSITSQYLGMALGQYYAYLCLCNSDYVTWINGSGMTGVNSASNPLVITFKDNGIWGSNVGDSFIIYAFKSQPPTNSNVAGWLEQYPTPFIMEKQD